MEGITTCGILPDSPQTRGRRVQKIELLLCITSIFLIFHLIVGLLQRRHRHAALGPVAAVLYTVSSFLIVYTLSLMQNAPFCHAMFPLWAAYLLMFQLGGVDTPSARSLENNEQWSSTCKQYVYYAYSFFSLLSLNLAAPKSTVVISTCLFLLMGFKAIERVLCLRSASKSALRQKFKFVADYMWVEHCISDVTKVDPVSMRGYEYVVKGDEADHQELITLEMVWNCEGWLLRTDGGDPDGRLKDICLSFSLFKLLILLYAGYPMPCQTYQKTRDLIQLGLLSSSDINGHERVFRVIQLELAFLYDLFYTRHPIIVLPSLWVLKLFHFLIVLAISVATATLLLSKYSPVKDPNSVLPVPLQVLVTILMLVIYAVVDFSQLLLFTCASEWAKVKWLCSYVKRKGRVQRYFERLLKAICSTNFFQWDRKLRQYSFIECVSRHPAEVLCNWLISFFCDQVSNGQKEIPPTRLTEHVKEKVVHSLTTNGSGYLRNGLSSLKRNGVLDQFSWACHLETDAQVIMVWHIATFYCEHEMPVPDPQQKENFETATKLSKYLAYLVVFAPKMLPDHPGVTQCVFDQAAIEASIIFEGCKNLEQRIKKLRSFSVFPMDDGIVGRAIWLGQQLANQIRDPESNEVRNAGFIWRILAEFWAEMVLYVAQSEDIEVHLKHLAQGGEFVTHLWVLLYHAGIKRAAFSPGEDEDEDEHGVPE